MEAWNARNQERDISILDPAVGDAVLLDAIIETVNQPLHQVKVLGFDTSLEALHQANNRIAAKCSSGIAWDFQKVDFLEHVLKGYSNDQEGLFPVIPSEHFDIVISNPPYIRTQVLGAQKSKQISRTFGLTGRVDMYYAFIEGIARVLNPGGVAGLIVSNRFMTVRSGSIVRERLRTLFNILHIWDLGDTKLFEAAVLPAVLLLERKGPNTDPLGTLFTSIYSTRNDTPALAVSSTIDALTKKGFVELPDGTKFLVRQGRLDATQELDQVWKIVDQSSQAQLAKVQAKIGCEFLDLGKIRVGVKTTADRVFIRDDWDSLPESLRPELLRPLLTHHSAQKYCSFYPTKSRKILYPHEVVNGKRVPVDLSQYPRSAAYLEQHRGILESRAYVIDSGRKWYELWVPQHPDLWGKPKLVFRDISEEPIFWLDLSGSIVNGDCYWLPFNDKDDPKIWIALAVANSNFIKWYYDVQFNNKLYAGRRRFMSQYVQHFPMPRLDSANSNRMIELSRRRYDCCSSAEQESIEREIDNLVWESFGLSSEEIGG